MLREDDPPPLPHLMQHSPYNARHTNTSPRYRNHDDDDDDEDKLQCDLLELSLHTEICYLSTIHAKKSTPLFQCIFTEFSLRRKREHNYQACEGLPKTILVASYFSFQNVSSLTKKPSYCAKAEGQEALMALTTSGLTHPCNALIDCFDYFDTFYQLYHDYFGAIKNKCPHFCNDLIILIHFNTFCFDTF